MCPECLCIEPWIIAQNRSKKRGAVEGPLKHADHGETQDRVEDQHGFVLRATRARLSRREDATIGDDARAGDEARIVGCKKQRDRCDIVRCAPPA